MWKYEDSIIHEWPNEQYRKSENTMQCSSYWNRTCKQFCYDFIQIQSIHRRHQFSVRIQDSNNINYRLTYVIALKHSRLQKFINNGVMNRLKYTVFEKKSHDITKHQPVSLISVIPLISFFSISVLLSTFILIIEKCIFVRKGKNISMLNHIPSIEPSSFYIKRKQKY